MLNFLKYFFEGMQKSISIGVPDFDTNNQFTDMENISNDFNIISKDKIKK
jgi:hypothetical protein